MLPVIILVQSRVVIFELDLAIWYRFSLPIWLAVTLGGYLVITPLVLLPSLPMGWSAPSASSPSTSFTARHFVAFKRQARILQCLDSQDSGVTIMQSSGADTCLPDNLCISPSL